MLKLTREFAVSAIVACAVIGTVTVSRSWHYQHYGWPAQVQREVLGFQIVKLAKPLSYDVHTTGFGEGRFRWTYKVDLQNPSLKQLCNSQPIETCRFGISRSLSQNIYMHIAYEDGVLTVEEAWH